MISFLFFPHSVLVFFTVIGFLSLITIISSLFLSLGARPSRISVPLVEKDIPPVDSEDFIQALSSVVNAPIQTGGRAELLNNGENFFPAIIKAIEEAHYTINFMVYIWTAGKASNMIFDALISAARRGVEVRMLFDGWGAMKLDQEKAQELKNAGAKLCWFRPARLGKLTRFYKRNHRRAIIIDGRVGFLGGAAIEDKWMGGAENPESWRDSMVRVTGNMAENLQSAFAQVWADTFGEIIIGKKFYPDQDNDPRNANPIKHISVISSPTSEFHPLSNVFWLTFKAARHSIYTTHSYFVPDFSTREVLKERARAGVDVRILVPNKYIDGAPIRWASHYYFEELLEAGVKIYEYQPTMIHAKTIVVDGKWSVIGSANLDLRSAELNKENVLGIIDEKFAQEITATFFEDLKHAEEIKLKSWKKRIWLYKVREWMSSWFQQQY